MLAKHHGPEGRTESKIGVSRGRNVPSEISYLLLYFLYTFLDFSMLLCPQRHGPPGRGNTMALKDERSPKYAFPGAGTSLLKSPRKSLLYTFLGFSMLVTGSCCCCCCCAHKDTALPDGETPWPWRTNGVQNTRFPGPERLFWNLLEKACYIPDAPCMEYLPTFTPKMSQM